MAAVLAAAASRAAVAARVADPKFMDVDEDEDFVSDVDMDDGNDDHVADGLSDEPMDVDEEIGSDDDVYKPAPGPFPANKPHHPDVNTTAEWIDSLYKYKRKRDRAVDQQIQEMRAAHKQAGNKDDKAVKANRAELLKAVDSDIKPLERQFGTLIAEFRPVEAVVGILRQKFSN
ncbi:hypothetical protein BCR44DRAFT_1435357 [Catenaria anguillulae PL171]|uniref:Uncharacterized protein n=1 Tax=Catenaria anguillulae PL171 TaxID=765915 RepID=A0A1Y2HJZ1_9FUNG|nr:hypothetical protein BCR44DRAFT_1435357 [Catenaria anguillulae PL171]